MAPPSIFIVEGNIGAGKTTLLKLLDSHIKEVVPVFEPVGDWLDLKAPDDCTNNGKSLFELYYADKAKYGFQFQMAALLTRMRHLKAVLDVPHPDGTLIVCERSFLSDHHVFAQLMRKQGQLTPMEYQVYQLWHGFLTEVLQPRVAGVIYMRVPPDVCVQRIHQRDRQGESQHISIDYIYDLHKQHDAFVASLPYPVYNCNPSSFGQHNNITDLWYWLHKVASHPTSQAVSEFNEVQPVGQPPSPDTDLVTVTARPPNKRDASAIPKQPTTATASRPQPQPQPVDPTISPSVNKTPTPTTQRASRYNQFINILLNWRRR